MRDGLFDMIVRFGIFLFSVVYPASVLAASALPKAVFSFGGLSERTTVLFVAKDQNFFQKHGIDGQVIAVRSGPVAMSALAAGEIHFHSGSATGASLGAMAGGLDLVFIAGLINKLDGAFVVSPGIKTVNDLKGKTVGVQSMGGGIWMFTMLAFEHWGLNPDRDGIKFRVVSDQAVIAQAIASGTLDASYLGYSFASSLERQGFRTLADLATLGIPYQGLGIMARRSFIDRAPDITERALRAIIEAVQFIHNPANKASVVRSLAKGLRLQKVEDAEAGYEMARTLYDRRFYPNRDGLRNVISILSKTNDAIRKLKVEDTFDDRVIRKLEKEGLF